MCVPLPPIGGHEKLRLITIPAGQVWYRINHRRHGTALHFSRGGHARWNDPRAAFGVLYVADTPGTAFAETFGHNLMDTYPPAADKFVSIAELEERCLYRITSRRELVLAQFSGSGLAAWTWRSDDGDSDILDILDEQGWGLV